MSIKHVDLAKPVISAKDLEGASLFIATPAHDWEVAAEHSNAMNELCYNLGKYGLGFGSHVLGGDSVAMARNYCVNVFLQSPATHFMFIDSDIKFDWKDVFALMALVRQPDNQFDIIGGPYRKK